MKSTIFKRAEFSLMHCEIWRKRERISQIAHVRYTAKNAIVTWR